MVGYAYGLHAFERPWMGRMIDKQLRVDSSATQAALGWSPRPRLGVLRRMPFLIENRKSHRAEWSRRNHAALRVSLRTGQPEIARFLDAEGGAIVDSFLEYVTDGSRSERFPHLRSVRRGMLEADTRLLIHRLSAAVRGESARFTYTVFVGDVAAVDVINLEYDVCSAEGVCESGEPLTSTVEGPTFAAEIELDPIAKKPGGGGGPVTPTLTLHNLGPGSALEATALITFGRISVSSNDFIVIPPTGMLSDGPECGDKCVAYIWVGDLSAGETITFTTLEGQSTIGGEEGTTYTATLIVTDTLGDFTTEPLTATAYGRVTHYANLIPEKTGPTVIGAGQDMTYTIQVFNSGLSTDTPPFPVLTETLPDSVTLVRVNDGGEWQTIGEGTMISWTLPSMSPGEITHTSFVVNVNEGVGEWDAVREPEGEEVAIGEPAEKGLDEELTDGEAGNDQAQLKIGGSFLGDVHGKEGDDKTQPHDRDGPRQGNQDQFFPEG